MRLPWPFGRRSSTGSAAPEAPAGAADEGRPALDAARAEAPLAPPTGAWAALPSIQRTIGDVPVVAPSRPFLAEVPGARPLPPIVEPLGHEVSPLAPPGQVVAQARPVASLTSRIALPTRPVQRRAGPGVAEWTDASPLADEPSVDIGPHPVTPAAVTEPEPVRRVGVVTPAATTAAPVRALTRTPETLLPVGARSSTAHPVVARTVAAPPSATGTTPPAPVAAGRRWAEAASAPDAKGAATSSGATPPLAGGPRRSGLGAPLPEAPPTAVRSRLAPGQRSLPMPPIQRTTAATPVSPPTSGEASVPAEPAGIAPDPRPRLPEPAAARLARLPVLPLAQRSVTPPAHRAIPEPGGSTLHPVLAGEVEPGPSATRHRTDPVATVTQPGTTPHVELPLAATAHPRQDSPPAAAVARTAPVTVSRIAAGPATAGSGTPAPSPTSPRPAIRPTVGRLPLRPSVPATTSDGGPPAASAGPAGPTPVTLPDPALPFVSTLPAPDHAAPSPMAQPVGMARAAASVQRTSAAQPAPIHRTAPPAPWDPGPGPSPMPLARVAPAATAEQPEMPVAQRVVAARATPGGEPVVQRAASAGPAGMTITATPVVQRADAPSAPTAEPGRQGQSDAELDELASKLFGRIRSRLRTEVIHEREAKGLTFDAF